MKPACNGKPQRFNNVRYQMRWRNQIDIMTAPALEIQHYISKLLVACLSPIAAVGNLPILAEDAEQITV